MTFPATPTYVTHGLCADYETAVAPIYGEEVVPAAMHTSWALDTTTAEMDIRPMWPNSDSWNSINTGCGPNTSVGLGLGLNAMLPTLHSTPMLVPASLSGGLTPDYSSPVPAHHDGICTQIPYGSPHYSSLLHDYALTTTGENPAPHQRSLYGVWPTKFQVMPLSPPMSEHATSYSVPASPMSWSSQSSVPLLQSQLILPDPILVQDLNAMSSFLPATPDYKFDADLLSDQSSTPSPPALKQSYKVSQNSAYKSIARQRQRRQKLSEKDAPQCPICSKLFSRQFNLKSHMITHEENRPKPFACDGCPRRFARKLDCERHMEGRHLGRKDWACEYCNKAFARKDTLLRHIGDNGDCLKRLTARSEGRKSKKNIASQPVTLREHEILPAAPRPLRQRRITNPVHLAERHARRQEEQVKQEPHSNILIKSEG